MSGCLAVVEAVPGLSALEWRVFAIAERIVGRRLSRVAMPFEAVAITPQGRKAKARLADLANRRATFQRLNK